MMAVLANAEIATAPPSSSSTASFSRSYRPVVRAGFVAGHVIGDLQVPGQSASVVTRVHGTMSAFLVAIRVAPEAEGR